MTWSMLIGVSPGLAPRVRDLVQQTAERLGVTHEEARRLVEVAIVTRGLEEMESDKG